MKRVVVCSKKNFHKEEMQEFFTQLEYDLGNETIKDELNSKIIVGVDEESYPETLYEIKKILKETKVQDRFSLVKEGNEKYFCENNLVKKYARTAE